MTNVRGPERGLFYFMVLEDGMTKPKTELDEFGLMAAVDALKRVSPEEQDAAILELEGDHPGIGARIKALLAIEKRTAEATAKLEKEGAKFEKEGAKAVEKLAVEKAAAADEPKAETFFKKPDAQPEVGKPAVTAKNAERRET